MKKTKTFMIISFLLTLVVNLFAQAPDPVIAFTFDSDISAGGTITAEISGITGELKGSAYCQDGDLILMQPEDSDYVALDANSIGISGLSEVSVAVSFTSDTLGYNGVTNQHIAVWGFGDIYDYNGGLGVDYVYLAASRQFADKAQAFVSCGYGAYCFEHQDTSVVYEPNLMDDLTHNVIVTIDATNKFGLFVDAEEIGYTELNGDTNNIAALSNMYAFIGRCMFGTNFVSAFKGRIHEFKIYDKALTAEDVAAIYGPEAVNAVSSNPAPGIYSAGSAIIVDLNSVETYNASINIFDLTGKQVKKLKNFKSREEIFMPAGIYLVQIVNGKNLFTRKIVVN